MQQGDQALAVCLQEAVVASAAKTLGRTCWMISQRKSAPASERFSGLRIAIAETHLAVLAGEDICFADDAAVEIDQCLLAAADRLAVRPPHSFA